MEAGGQLVGPFCPSTVWVLGIEVRLSGMVVSTFIHRVLYLIGP